MADKTWFDTPCETFSEVVSPVLGAIGEEDAGFHLWNHTAFPFMGDNWHHYRFQLAEQKSTIDAGYEPCEHCGQRAVVHGPRFHVCISCWQSPIFDHRRANPERYGMWTERRLWNPTKPNGTIQKVRDQWTRMLSSVKQGLRLTS